jgi:hypothetical protein
MTQMGSFMWIPLPVAHGWSIPSDGKSPSCLSWSLECADRSEGCVLNHQIVITANQVHVLHLHYGFIY